MGTRGRGRLGGGVCLSWPISGAFRPRLQQDAQEIGQVPPAVGGVDLPTARRSGRDCA